jgi:hypothetical protein
VTPLHDVNIGNSLYKYLRDKIRSPRTTHTPRERERGPLFAIPWHRWTISQMPSFRRGPVAHAIKADAAIVTWKAGSASGPNRRMTREAVAGGA